MAFGMSLQGYASCCLHHPRHVCDNAQKSVEALSKTASCYGKHNVVIRNGIIVLGSWKPLSDSALSENGRRSDDEASFGVVCFEEAWKASKLQRVSPTNPHTFQI